LSKAPHVRRLAAQCRFFEILNSGVRFLTHGKVNSSRCPKYFELSIKRIHLGVSI
jgi:hypothetical protein